MAAPAGGAKPMRRPNKPAAPMAGALVAAALLYDLWLIRNNYQTISTWVRSSRWRKAVAVYLAVHLCVKSRFDPLHQIGKAIDAARKAEESEDRPR